MYHYLSSIPNNETLHHSQTLRIGNREPARSHPKGSRGLDYPNSLGRGFILLQTVHKYDRVRRQILKFATCL